MVTLVQRSTPAQRLLARSRAAVGDLDWVLVALTAAMAGFGVFVVRAATRDDIAGSPNYYFVRQVAYVLVGIVLMFACQLVDLERLARARWVLYGMLCTATAIVLAIGSSVRGSSRWIDLGVFQLQPSELGKVVLILVLAAVAVSRSVEHGAWRHTLRLIAIALVPALVVFAQPDLGTTLVYLAILATILLMSGIPVGHLVTLAASVAAAVLLVLVVLPAVGRPVLQGYQLQRLTAFTNSSDTSSNAGYQLVQSKIAIGSGGGFGRGVSGASQTQSFLPEHHTDFIFAVVGEMFGFVGGAALILVWGLILWRAIRIAGRAPTALEQLVASGVVGMFGFQLFVNIGMNMGIMPITGIPLPLVSYGGSHTLTNFVAVGLLLRIGRRRGPLIAG